MNFFSDREKQAFAKVGCINNDVWRGIVAVIDKQIKSDLLSKSFPMQCPDGNDICGLDEGMFTAKLKALIPNMEYPFSDNIEQGNPFATPGEVAKDAMLMQYAVLDTIEFIYSHIHDVVKDSDRYHSFYKHYELFFPGTLNEREVFRNDINDIFQRNGILFCLDETGQIKRIAGKGMNNLIERTPVPADDTLKNLIALAIGKFLNPRIEERKLGLCELWKAFERTKTLFDESAGKKSSSDALLDAVAKGDANFKALLNDEARVLTDIGNKFQIRHSEVSKYPVGDADLIDYFISVPLKWDELNN